MKIVPCKLLHHRLTLCVMPPELVPQIVLTVQHNGMSDSVFNGQFIERDEKDRNDLGVMALAMSIYRKAYPYVGVVYNQIPRRYVDTNRDPDSELKWRKPFADPKLASYFFDFHDVVQKTITNSLATHVRKVCLIDLHGFAGQPPYAPKPGYDVILGTRNRRTVRSANFGGGFFSSEWLDLDRKLREILVSSGLSVFCPEYEPYQQREWLRRVSTSFPDAPLLARGIDSTVDELAEAESETVLPPSMPDYYDGGYLIAKCIQDHPKLSAAIQAEVFETLRRRIPDQPHNEKRELFVDSIAKLVQKICS